MEDSCELLSLSFHSVLSVFSFGSFLSFPLFTAVLILHFKKKTGENEPIYSLSLSPSFTMPRYCVLVFVSLPFLLSLPAISSSAQCSSLGNCTWENNVDFYGNDIGGTG